MSEKRIEEIEAKIADLKKRWPEHSVPPALMQELDELEEQLEKEQLKENNEKPRSEGSHA